MQEKSTVRRRLATAVTTIITMERAEIAMRPKSRPANTVRTKTAEAATVAKTTDTVARRYIISRVSTLVSIAATRPPPATEPAISVVGL